MINFSKKEKGFTLVEIIISLAIFAMVAVVALGALVKIVSANKKAQTLQSAMTNLNFALESMSREIRTGSEFSGTSGGITFNSPKVIVVGGEECNIKIGYKIVQNSGGNELQKAVGPDDSCTQDLSYSSVLEQRVFVSSGSMIEFLPAGPGRSYPLISVLISGYVGARERERTYFTVQTAISPRII